MWQTQLFSVSGDIPNTFETALKVAHSDGYVERVSIDIRTARLRSSGE
jgi:hypothetical protein